MSPSTGAPPSSAFQVLPLPPFTPDLYERAWCSVPHPTLPLIATAHSKSVTIFSLSSFTPHSTLTNGHKRSIRSLAWQPNQSPHQLCLVTGSFDSSAGVWRWNGEPLFTGNDETAEESLETDVGARRRRRRPKGDGGSSDGDGDGDEDDDEDWTFSCILDGHEAEIKGVAISPSGAYLATCSRDQTVWIWEDQGVEDGDDNWETIAVLNEHTADVKGVAWCPDVPARNSQRTQSVDVLASASYDDNVRIWREDSDGDWVCVAVLEGHAGTVWGVEWEQKPRSDNRFPRLMTYSADQTIRIWSLKEEETEGGGGSGAAGFGSGFGSGWGGIPNTMRRSLREEWVCTAILPKAHTRDIYSVTWSAKTGLVASTGSDGVIAMYREDESAESDDAKPNGDADADVASKEGHMDAGTGKAGELPAGSSKWRVETTVSNAHGPYEINHITWCTRFDAGSERKGEEEMLVTTGDEGIVRPWQVILPTQKA